MAGKKHFRPDLDKLGKAVGFGIGRDFAEDVKTYGMKQPGALRQAKNVLRANLEKEEALRRGAFALTLQAWGLRADELPAYICYKTSEIRGGILLALVSLGADMFQMFGRTQSHFVSILATTAILSMFCCGVLLALTAGWRVRVCRNRSFVPFLVWLKGLFLPEKNN